MRCAGVHLPRSRVDQRPILLPNERLGKKRSNTIVLLLISEDLDEVLSLSDRVAPIYEGEFMGLVSAKNAKMEDIGAMMAGLKVKVGQP